MLFSARVLGGDDAGHSPVSAGLMHHDAQGLDKALKEGSEETLKVY
jgi:hypothetical protein